MTEQLVRAAGSHMPGRVWRPVVSGHLAEAASQRVLEVAELIRQQSLWDDPQYVGSLESAAGVAVLYGQLDRAFPDQSWDVAAHEFLARAVRGIERDANTEPGLFNGLGGIAFTAWSLARGGTRYGGLLAGLDDRVIRGARELAKEFAASPVDRPIHQFDVISGLAGIGGYLLLRKDEPAFAEILPTILEALVASCGEGSDGPNWFVSADSLGPTTLADAFPGGMYNCGLAHGVPGPLVTLSLALEAGLEVDGQREAVERVGHWLVDQRTDDEWGSSWTIGVDREQAPRHPAHNAWCYGSAGVGRALWLAGESIGDNQLRAEALEAMDAIYRRPWANRAIDRSPGLCHGVGGLLHLTARFSVESDETTAQVDTSAAAAFADEAVGQVERLLDLFDPKVATGYYTVESGDVRRASVGLLDGAAGAALALLAATTAVDPVWDRLLLMA